MHEYFSQYLSDCVVSTIKYQLQKNENRKEWVLTIQDHKESRAYRNFTIQTKLKNNFCISIVENKLAVQVLLGYLHVPLFKSHLIRKEKYSYITYPYVGEVIEGIFSILDGIHDLYDNTNIETIFIEKIVDFVNR